MDDEGFERPDHRGCWERHRWIDVISEALAWPDRHPAPLSG